MDVLEYKNCPILVVDDEVHKDTVRGRALRKIGEQLKELGFSFILASAPEEAEPVINTDFSLSCIVLDAHLEPVRMINAIRKVNRTIPIFIIGEDLKVVDLPEEMVTELAGYVWPLRDTYDFIAGRIENAAKWYIHETLPPFFGELLHYAYRWKYAWHTPGHMGGVAFRKSPAGRFFYDYLGENVFRSDLSVSVPELGSLLDHSGVVGEAERQAAGAFGANNTYFVTNGTSTSNQIVSTGTVARGEAILADRNCHKSAMQGIISCGGIPTYFIPTRNAYGIIGLIHNKSFDKKAVEKMIKDCPLIKGKDKKKKGKLAIITNTTYDGIAYNIPPIKEKLKDMVDYLQFDEAWFGYAAFHPMYAGRYGMHATKNDSKYPTTFATQSTHKVLAAFSQASMVHQKNGKAPFDPDTFNFFYMMHTSTSPQYEIIASLDVATKMMMDNGEDMVSGAIEEAIEFRKRIARLKKQHKKKGDWWFTAWQPDRIKGKAFEDVPTKKLKKDPSCWVLEPNAKWHGFGNLEKNHALLDPIKVTIVGPGISESGKMEKTGIPAAIVTYFMKNNGVVVEKTGYYSFLVLFTIGVTEGKTATLLSVLSKFKQHYDANTPIKELFPELVAGNQERYGKLGLKDLCNQMHAYLVKEKVNTNLEKIFSDLPKQELIPADAYKKLVEGKVDKVRMKDLAGRTSAVMIIPYPPGIPMIMPGEKFSPNTKTLMNYFAMCERFDNEFPGFENNMEGMLVKEENGKKAYYQICIKK